MKRNVTAIGAALMVAVASPAMSACSSPDRPTSDCDTVHSMLEFNQSHNERLAAQSTSNEPVETDISDYRAWADELKQRAAKVTDPGLAQHAQEMANLASRTVGVVEQARDDAQSSPPSGPPPWVAEYSALNKQFRAEVSALDAACPGDSPPTG